MILSAQSIRARVLVSRAGYLGAGLGLDILPFCERTIIHGMSYGLSACGYDVCIKDGMVLDRGGFALATTVEWFSFPADIRGALADKSTWARRGIVVQNTRFEPGWYGFPTIEISNHGLEAVFIPPRSPIAQMEFALLDAPTDQPYTGKYQDQPQRPVEAISEK